MSALSNFLLAFRRRPLLSSLVAGVGLLVLLLAVGRWWITTDSGRDFVISQIDGRDVAGYGHLSVRHLEGDPLSEFTLGSLEIRDTSGAWISAKDIRINWSPMALMSRRVDLETLVIGDVTFARQPIREPRPKSDGGNWTVRLGRGTVERLVLEEGIAGPRSAFSLSARFVNERGGTLETDIALKPLEGAGDRIDAEIRRKPDGAFDIKADGIAPANGVFAHLLRLPEGSSAVLTSTGAGNLKEGFAEAKLAIDGTDKVFLSCKLEDASVEASLRLDASALPVPASVANFLGAEAQADLAGTLEKDSFAFKLDTRFKAGTASLTGRLKGGALKLDGPARLAASLSTLDPFWNGARGLKLDGELREESGVFHYSGDTSLAVAEGSILPFESFSGPVHASYENGRIPFTGNVSVLNLLAQNSLFSNALGPDVRLTGNGVYDVRQRSLVIDAAEVTHKSGTAQLLGEADFRERTLNLSGRIAQSLVSLPGNLSGGASGFVQAKGSFDDVELGLNLNLANVSTRIEAIKPLVDGPGSVRGILKLKPGAGTIQRLDVRLRGFLGQVTGAIYGPGAPDIRVAGTQQIPLLLAGNVVDLDTVNVRIVPEANGLRISGSSSGGDAYVSGRDVTALSSTIDLKFVGEAIFGPVKLSGVSGGQPASASFYLDRRDAHTKLENLHGKLADIMISGSAQISDDGTLDLDVDASAAKLTMAGLSFGSLSFKGSGGRSSDDPLALGGEFIARDIQFTEHFVVDSVNGTVTTTADGYKFTGKLVDTEDGARSKIDFSGLLKLADGSTAGTLSLDGSLLGIALATPRDIAWTLEPTLTLDADLSALGGRISAEIHPQGSGGGSLVSIDKVSLGPLLAALNLPEMDAVLTGSASGNFFGAAPSGTLRLAARSPVSGLDTSIDLSVDGTLDRKKLALKGAAAYGPTFNLTAAADIPVRTANGELVAPDRSAMLKGEADVDGDLGALSLIAIAYGHDIGGNVKGHFDLGGSLKEPSVKGTTTISNGTYEYGAKGLRLTGLSLDAGIENSTLDVKGSSSGPGGGELTFDGRLAETETGITVKLDRLLVYDRAGDFARVSGTAKLSELEDHRLLDGKLTIDQARFAIDNLSGNTIRTLNVRWDDEEAAGRRDVLLEKPIRLDLDVSASRGITFHGRGLDTDWGVKLRLTGAPDSILLNGKATLARGTLELARRPFEFESGQITFDGPPDTARMAISANRDVDGFSVGVDVGGSPSRPTIELSSTPSLPEDEILSRMLFGRSAVDLSALEAAELATSIARLAGRTTGLDPVGSLQTGLGVDRLRLGVDSDGNAELGVGQYLTSDVYLEVTTQGAAGNSVEVEWQPKPQVSVTSETSSTGESRLSVRWKRDY